MASSCSLTDGGSNTVDASEFHLFARKKLKDSPSNTTDGNVSSAGTSSTPTSKTSAKEGDSSRRTRRLNVLQIFFSRFFLFSPDASPLTRPQQVDLHSRTRCGRSHGLRIPL